MSTAERPSWACPAVSFSRIGRPAASTKAWIFVLSPPRERPMQSDRSLLGTVGPGLVNPDREAVDHLHITIVRL